jgi:hypothetical protein
LKILFVSRGGYGDTFEALFYLRVGHGFFKQKSASKTSKTLSKLKEFQRLQKLSNEKRASKTLK